MLKEFREFIARGNVMDLAVGVIIGGAFGAIVKSLVDQIIMPPVGLITGGVDFAATEVRAEAGRPGKKVAEVAIGYGAFVNTVIDFLIVAFVIFLLVKAINSMQAPGGGRRGAAARSDADRGAARRDPRPAQGPLRRAPKAVADRRPRSRLRRGDRLLHQRRRLPRGRGHAAGSRQALGGGRPAGRGRPDRPAPRQSGERNAGLRVGDQTGGRVFLFLHTDDSAATTPA